MATNHEMRIRILPRAPTISYKNKEDQRDFAKKHYLENKASYKINREKTRARNKKFLLDYKENKVCGDCGFDNPIALEFHHLKDKKYNVAQLVSQGVSLKTFQQEIDKCILICANCHRIRHHGN